MNFYYYPKIYYMSSSDFISNCEDILHITIKLKNNELVDKLAVAAKNRNTFDNEEIK